MGVWCGLYHYLHIECLDALAQTVVSPVRWQWGYMYHSLALHRRYIACLFTTFLTSVAVAIIQVRPGRHVIFVLFSFFAHSGINDLYVWAFKICFTTETRGLLAYGNLLGMKIQDG